MTDIQAKGSERSEEYTRLLVGLKNSLVSTASIAVKLYKQGKKTDYLLKRFATTLKWRLME